MRFSARIIGVFLSFLLVLLFLKTSYAQSTYLNTNSQQQYLAPNTNPDVPRNLHSWTQNVMIEVFSSFGCQLTGYDFTTKSQSCLGIDSETGKIGFVKNGGGAIGVAASMIAALYTPPIHTSSYIQYLSSNFGLSKPTYAQTTGIGFEGLNPLVNVWTAFRNIVYLLFVLIFIVIGFAIMLRIRIDPRTVMTVQNQIPKIVIGLILITFSFAIAGLLIDFMWVATYVVINVISSADPNIPRDVTSQLYNNPFGFGQKIFGANNSIAGNAAHAIQSIIYNTLNPINAQESTSACAGGLPILCNIQDLIGGVLNTLINGVIGGIVSYVIGVVAFLIITIAILWAMFKLWFALLKAYIMILLDVALAPFWIIAGLVPNPGGEKQSLGFGNWIRDLLGNLMAFPAVIGLFLLGKIFFDEFGSVDAAALTGTSPHFVPPLVGGITDTSSIGYLIALGIILASPSVVEMTKKAFKAPGVTGMGEAGGMLMAGAGFAGAMAGGAFRRTFRTQTNQLGEKIAVGAGARWIETKAKRPIVRKIFGYGAETNAEIIKKATQGTGIKRKNLVGERAQARQVNQETGATQTENTTPPPPASPQAPTGPSLATRAGSTTGKIIRGIKNIRS